MKPKLTLFALLCILLLGYPVLTHAWFDKGFETETGEDVKKKQKAQPDSLPQKQSNLPQNPRPGDTWTEPVTGMEFVWVEGGCYMMGSPLTGKPDKTSLEDRSLWYKALSVASSLLPYGCVAGSRSPNRHKYKYDDGETHEYDDDETPVHEVCVDGFWMGKYEVTNGQYRLFDSGHSTKKYVGGYLNQENYPVAFVSWNDAQKFIEWLSRKTGQEFSLPTEAEWEYAARSGGKKERYAGGNDVRRVAWYRRNSGGRRTHKVGTKDPNGLGLYDMSGNVWEWCEDVYEDDAYSIHSRNNPVITSGGSRRVNRGGSWISLPGNLRAANRHRNSSDYALSSLGFRLCLSDIHEVKKITNSSINYQDKEPGRLFVDTRPSDASVDVLNIDRNYVYGMKLPPGRYNIQASKKGFIAKNEWRSLSENQNLKVFINLKQKRTKVSYQELQPKESDLPQNPRAGDTWKEPVTGMEFVWVEGGCYMMGQTQSEKQYLIDEIGKDKYKKYCYTERPRHKVCLDGFWMGKTEVTRGQFRKFVKASGYRTDADRAGKARIKNKDTDWEWEKKSGYNWEKTGYSQTDRHPVACVSWNDAKAFFEWLSERSGKVFRLPTEAEWEYAARGGTETMRFWGDDESNACRYANVADKGRWRPSFFCGDGYKFTAPVGSFTPNPFGLHDMLGNLCEWCEDVYDRYAYSKHSRRNPLITSGGLRRVLRLITSGESLRVGRGGSWGNIPWGVRAAFRVRDPADNAISNLGFRLCFSRVR